MKHCRKCGGYGVIQQFMHVNNGVCYACGGVRTRHDAPAPTREEVPADMEYYRSGYIGVCYMDVFNEKMWDFMASMLEAYEAVIRAGTMTHDAFVRAYTRNIDSKREHAQLAIEVVLDYINSSVT